MNLSGPGIVLGALLMAVSLTPSLLPRNFIVQGLLSGASLSIGYLIGVFARWAWHFAELPNGSDLWRRGVRRCLGGLCAIFVAYVLSQTADWQNAVRQLMGMGPADSAHPVRVTLIAIAVFSLLLMIARLFRRTKRFLSFRFKRLKVPPRLSMMLGGIAAAGLFAAVLNGIVLERLMRLADSSFQEIDQRLDTGIAPPSSPGKTGSPASLVAWETLGARGRDFVSSGPTGDDIARFFGEDAPDPVRVYVGLNSRETVQERAALALAELIRTGGFNRSVLLVVVPTGTGWIDPAALDTVEYLHRGDIASVALQYSYLTSFLSLLVEPGYGAEAGRALFKAVYDHWTSLPRNDRPRLYLHGLSLGAMNSMLSTDFYEVIADPFAGALWSGPPFNSTTWRDMTNARVPGSPAWLPKYRDGSVVRFGNQAGGFDQGAPWGPLRIAFLQYASDPVVFFEAASFYREPQWMKEPRGRDIAPEFRWFPVITMLQLTFDMAIATTSPVGFGHLYAPEHYIDAWIAVTEPPRIDADTVRRLKEKIQART
jgi:uncharacterized membrane protein